MYQDYHPLWRRALHLACHQALFRLMNLGLSCQASCRVHVRLLCPLWLQVNDRAVFPPKREMKNSGVAFQACDGGTRDSIGCEQMTCHLTFDVKLSERFKRKARFVAHGGKVSTPPSMSHSTVISGDSVGMSLLAAALNNPNTSGCDAWNAFPWTSDLKQHCLIAGDESGHKKGEIFIVLRALHGLE